MGDISTLYPKTIVTDVNGDGISDTFSRISEQENLYALEMGKPGKADEIVAKPMPGSNIEYDTLSVNLAMAENNMMFTPIDEYTQQGDAAFILADVYDEKNCQAGHDGTVEMVEVVKVRDGFYFEDHVPGSKFQNQISFDLIAAKQ